MTLIYAVKLGLVTWKNDFNAQKIDGLPLVIYEMVLTGFSIEDKLKNVQFFKKTFLLAYTSMKVILRISFITFSDVNMQFWENKLE